MSEKLPIEMKDVSFDFLLYRHNQYELMTTEESEMELLPSVSVKYKPLLVKNNISFNVVGDKCTVYDKDLYETKKRYLPVYVKEDGVYKYTGRYRMKKIPTKESLIAAKKVVEGFLEYAEIITKLLKDQIIVFIPKPVELPIERNRFMEKHRVFCYEAGQFGYILVDCKKVSKMVERNKETQMPVKLILRVPSSYNIGGIIGKDGKNIDPLIRFIGVDEITVLPKKE